MKNRKFNKWDLDYITNGLRVRVDRMEYEGDLSDLGNEVGMNVGYRYKDMTQDDINDFINGFKHGVSLTNGTH